MITPQRLSLFWNRYGNLFPFFLGSIFIPLCVFPFLPSWDLSKFILLYLLTALSLFFMFPNNVIFLPQLNQFQKYLIASILTLLLYNYFYHKIDLLSVTSVERILFWVLFFYY